MLCNIYPNQKPWKYGCQTDWQRSVLCWHCLDMLKTISNFWSLAQSEDNLCKAYNTVSDQGEEGKRWAMNFQFCLRSIRGHCCNGWCNMDKSGNTVKKESWIVNIFGACWWCLRNSHWDFVSINYVEMIRIKNCDIVQIYSQKKST